MNIAEKLPYLRIVCNYSDDCNFNCRWCHHEGVYTRAGRTLLSLEQIVSVADEFFKIGVRKFKILGGEPTLQRDLEGIIRGLRGIDKATRMHMIVEQQQRFFWNDKLL